VSFANLALVKSRQLFKEYVHVEVGVDFLLVVFSLIAVGSPDVVKVKMSEC